MCPPGGRGDPAGGGWALERYARSASWEGEDEPRVVEGGVRRVDGRVVVGTQQGQVLELVLAAAGEPDQAVPLAAGFAVVAAGVEPADLAAPAVQRLQVLHAGPRPPDVHTS